MHTASSILGLVIVILVVAFFAASSVIGRRRGYAFGNSTVVRCQKGHLFTTVWIPGGSFKSIRLGFYRFQYCPVGGHWALVRPVKEMALSDEDKRFAANHRDSRIP